MTTAQAQPESGRAFAAPELSDDVQVWIVRHGETEWSRTGRHTGTTDLPLTEAGKDQARALRGMLAGVSPALVLCSPLTRALETARLAGLSVDEVTPDLAEWNYGAYEGRTTAEIRRERPGWSLWTDGVPDGESPQQVAERADRVLRRVAESVRKGPVVLVGHGHFSRALGARWIGLPISGGANLALGTAAPSVLGAQYGAPLIDRWNLPNPAA
ncbi:MAG TPA: histidine phosphatase family protein [Jatrophihabitans sp.]|nr:histidine phosphatase family protein [Jatrophihabitans sp.]